MPPKFFITHSWQDIEFARRLTDDLRTHGLEGFFDAYSLQPGDDIAGRIARGLEQCDIYIPILSPAAVASPWCELEINTAINLSVAPENAGRPRIIPVVAQKCTIPTLLRSRLYIIFENRYDAALGDLLTKGFSLTLSPSSAASEPHVTVHPAPTPEPARPLHRVPLIAFAGISVILLLVLVVVLVFNSNKTTLGVGSTDISKQDGAVMVYVPVGDFKMGSSNSDSQAKDDEKPQRTLHLDAFWVDKYLVTNALYTKCVDAGKCTEPSNSASSTHTAYYGNAQFDNYPVIDVDWNQAKSFCEWAGKQLPTEAQWEKAARGTDGRIYPWGNTFDQNRLNSAEGGRRDTTEVGSYTSGASPYGALDMVGNVWEWVADWYDAGYYANSSRDNPTGPSSGAARVLRGGSWLNQQINARVANRNQDNPGDRVIYYGFRCAKSAP